MRIELPVTEALALGAAAGALPPFLREVRADGSVVHLMVDAGMLMGRQGGLGGFLGGLLGVVPVTVTFSGYADGVATVTLRADARGLPVHRFLPLLEGQIRAQLAQQGIPDGVVDFRTGAGDPVIAVDVQRLVAAKVAGVTVSDVALRDATVHVTAVVGRGEQVRLR